MVLFSTTLNDLNAYFNATSLVNL